MSVPLSVPFSKVLDFLKNKDKIIAIETGVSFLWHDKYMQNLSTYNIIEHIIKPFVSAEFHSFDINSNHLDTCHKELEKRQLREYVTLHHNFSTEIPDILPESLFDFVWMDSAEDSKNSELELEIFVNNSQPQWVLCVDDYGSQNSVKWQIPSEYIKRHADYFETYNTQTGLIVGYFNG